MTAAASAVARPALSPDASAATEAERPAPPAPWTCPFCPLLCDAFQVDTGVGASPLRLVGSDCPRAAAALARFGAVPVDASPQIDGAACSWDDAVAAAARLLAASRQPLFGGLGTDVAGARALYALACRTGAVSDPAGGPALMMSVRATQDRGGFTTTLAEIRNRADLIVCLGDELPTDRYPELFRRFGVGQLSKHAAHVVWLGGAGVTARRAELAALAGPRAECIGVDGDLFDTLARLAAAVAGPATDTVTAAAPLAMLATRLLAARYAVLVYDTAGLPVHGGLAVEAVGRIVASLNRSTRAAAFPLGGSDGAGTVNQVYGWLSGLPLRSRAGPAGLEHEPFCFNSGRLLASGDVDALLWVASYGTEPPPPDAALPRVVLGHPAHAGRLGSGARTVFIPVGTPAIGSAGHLFRVDGSLLMPLRAAVPDRLPTVAAVVGRLLEALAPGRPEAGTRWLPEAAP